MEVSTLIFAGVAVIVVVAIIASLANSHQADEHTYKMIAKLKEDEVDISLRGVADLLFQERPQDAEQLRDYLVEKNTGPSRVEPEYDDRILLDDLRRSYCLRPFKVWMSVLSKEEIMDDANKLCGLIKEGFDFTLDSVTRLLSEERFSDAFLLAHHFKSEREIQDPSHILCDMRNAENLKMAIQGLMYQNCTPLILEHVEALARNKKRLTYQGEYNEEITKDWEAEKQHFIKSVLAPQFHDSFKVVDWLKQKHFMVEQLFTPGLSNPYYPEQDPQFLRFIDALTELHVQGFIMENTASDIARRNGLDDPFGSDSASNEMKEPRSNEEIVQSNDGRDYERKCLNRFLNAGAEARATPVTGDQGADIIFNIEGKRGVAQCKDYSSPIGNKAIQEAHAAKGWHHSDLAAVIAKSGYTKSARQLAKALGVHLLHHDQIGSFVDQQRI